MKTGDRIKELRKNKNLTQLELATKLNITDKAVSKWESNLGEPSIDLLLKLSTLFDVSIDYLLTGINREKVISMSEFERVTYEDDPAQINDLKLSFDVPDDKGFTFAHYIYKHEAKKVFVAMVNSQHKNWLLHGWDHKYYTEFFQLCLITNNFELLDQNAVRPFIPLYKIQIENNNSKHKQLDFAVDRTIVDFILHSDKMNDEAWNTLLDTNSLYWGSGISEILEAAVKEKHPVVKKILDRIEPSNEKVLELSNSNNQDSMGTRIYCLRDNILYKNNKHEMIYTDITKETVLAALENNDYELVERLNKLSNFKVSDYELKMDKVNKDKTMTKKDKLIEYCLHNGIVHIDDLIALDDYDVYLEGIQHPASELERVQNLVKNKEYKKVFEYAQNMKLSRTLDNLRKNINNELEETLNIDFKSKNIEYAPNAKYLYGIKKHYGKVTPLGKKTILFKDIINHKDYRFFEHAAKTDSTKLDWALETIVKDRPEEYKLQKILLDTGAKLHKRWSQDDGWGYTENIDQVDDVGTEMLKNQIKILLKKGNKNDE